MTTERGAASTTSPAPGTSVGNGRYLLLAFHGGRAHLQFWQGFDQATERQVALTLVDPHGALPEEFVHEILASTVRLRGIDMPGIARVIEVFHTGRFGVVVSEWIRGGGLGEVADTAPSPAGVASAMQTLAGAAEAAHRGGLVLSIDDPNRLRIGADGHAALAFPATMPDATVASDLHGIGVAMCVLLKLDSRRPVRDSGIPFLIATTIEGLLRGSHGIASAGTLLTLLREAVCDDAESVRVMPPLAPPPPGRFAWFRNFGPDEQATAVRRQIMRIGMVAAAVILVVALVTLGSTLNRIFGDNHDTPSLNADKLGLSSPTSSPAQPPPEVAPKRATTEEERVPLISAAVFSPDGSPDSPDSAGAAIDGNPATAWSTDTYYDADPFPKFKPGVGLLVQLAQPTAVKAVAVDLNSTGTVVQVRAAANNKPAALADTTELTPPTPMQPGHNRIPVTAAQPVSTVLVWISTLGSSNGMSRAAISEITLDAASPPA
ncbi:MAG TPA: protein kinase family protein [Mycobacterium sp.]|nr:protein kinase family protein [Mycobacterium sp.]